MRGGQYQLVCGYGTTTVKLQVQKPESDPAEWIDIWTLDQNFNGKKAILDDKACMKLFDTLAGIGWLKITPKSPAS